MVINKEKIHKYICIFILILLLPGCVGRRELDNLGIINLMGVDLTENGKYKISVHIIKPATGQGGQPANTQSPGSTIWVGEAEGETIQECLKNIRAKTSWLLIWSHCDNFCTR